MAQPRKLSLVRDAGEEGGQAVKGVCVFLGEIPNMRGHGVYVERETGKILVGYHITRFRELTDDET